MERVHTRRRACKELVKKIFSSLAVSLQGLSIQDTPSGHDASRLLDIHFKDQTPEPPSAANCYYKQYRHGDASTALHACLADLYAYPFAAMSLVAIDGYERIYCNPFFEQLFITAAECNRRLLLDSQSPTYHIITR